MKQDQYLFKVLSEIIKDSRKYFNAGIEEHLNELFGNHDSRHPLIRIHHHIHSHFEKALEKNKEKGYSVPKEGIIHDFLSNANLVSPILNRLHFSFSGSQEIHQIPIIDNHSHAGDFEKKFNCPKGLTLKVLMDIVELTTALSVLSPQEGKELWEIYQENKKDKVEDFLFHKGIYEKCKDSVKYFQSTSMWNMLVQGLREIYPGILNEQDIAHKIEKQRQFGLVSCYTQMFDKAKIMTAFCQRDDLEPIWDTQRFKLLLRLDPFIELKFHEPLFKIAMDAQGLNQPAAEFDDYISFLEQTIQHFKDRGTVAVKIHCAYVRPLFFEQPSLDEARKAFIETYDLNKTAIELDQYCHPLEQRKKQYPFQDYITRHLLEFCGKIALPVQFHTGLGFLPGLEFKNSSPLNLENVINDPLLRKTKLVLLHAGYPFFSEAVNLARMWSNVYLDISGLTFLFNTSLSNWLTECIEYLPENKILFGSDAIFPELYYVAAKNGRQQLALALENLIKSNLLSVNKATRIAEGILYKNAQFLYSLTK